MLELQDGIAAGADPEPAIRREQAGETRVMLYAWLLRILHPRLHYVGIVNLPQL